MDEVIQASARLHKALADHTRLEMCWLLAERQRNVTELAEELSISQPLVSYHLRILREAGLVAGRRASYWTLYELLPQRLELLKEGTEALLASVSTPKGTGRDRARPRPSARH